MSPRELVILILGLAIVAVVLRGLYVALQARRGQIRLAIDKNIPKDIDLNALEMAELPSGGARVVERSLAEVNRQNHAAKKAQVMNLADKAAAADPIPVLMDPVALQSQPEPVQTGLLDEGIDDVSVAAPAPVVGYVAESDNGIDADDYVSASGVADQGEYAEQPVAEFDEDDQGSSGDDPDPDSVLFDYGEPVAKVDNLSQVTPDYDDGEDEFDDSDEFDSDYDDYDDEDDLLDEDDQTDQDFDEDDFDEELDDDRDDDLDEDDYDDDEDEDESDAYGDYDPLDDDDLLDDDIDDGSDDDSDDDFKFADDDLDDFSMTAGERIGFTPTNKPQTQPELFSDEDAPRPEAFKSRRKPLFATLGRKLMQKARPDDTRQTEQARSAPAKRQTTVSEEPASASAAQRAATVATSKPVIAHTPPAAAVPEPAVVVVSKPKAKEVAVTPAQPRVASVADAKIDRSAKIESTKATSENLSTEPSEVVVLNVMAKPGRVIGGDDLLRVLITSGMKFGDMNIFHRRLGGDNKGPIIFSIANILNPGTFDLNKMHEFTTLGVSLFLALPTSINNLEALNQMLTVADQICDAFDAELRDDNRNLMTAQTIEHYRQRIRDFELRRLKAVGARG